MTNKKYDVIVIGGGPGGYVCAIKLAKLGKKVACIEGRGSLGGTCLNVGCIPSKAMLHFSEIYSHAKHFTKDGMFTGDISPDILKIMNKKNKNVTELTQGIEFLFKKNKVDYIKGYAEFISDKEVKVNQDTYNADNFVIATGSSVASLPNIEIDEEVVVSSTGALELKEIPKKMVVIGAGVIGLELGSVYNNFGSEVYVVEYCDKVLPPMDNEVSKNFEKILKKQGIKFNLSSKVTSIKRTGKSATVDFEDKEGNKNSIEADIILVAVGRKPNTNGLKPENAGIKLTDRGFIEVNEKLQAKNNIYAIGDVIGGQMLAHKAEEEGIMVAELIAGNVGHINYNIIPSVVYTSPEVASVGKTEEELKNAGINYKKGSFPFVANSRAKAISETDGFVKILVDERDTILGAHLIGPFAGEMIGELVIAMEYKASAQDVSLCCHAHPTFSEAIKEACMAVNNDQIHS